MIGRTVLMGLLALSVGCAFDSSGRKKSSAAVVSRSLKEVRPAPPTHGADADGKPVNLADHAGKVVLLSFWHSACPPCRAMFVHEKALVAKHSPALFALIGVNADPDAARLKQTQTAAGLNYPSIADGPDGPLCAAWEVEAFPTLVLVDPSGHVRWRHAGLVDAADLDRRIRGLIEETQVTAK